jgi:transcriptional regulator with XRE-family HTH domain
VGLRHDLGLSQTELARLTGFGEASIKRWESGVLIQNISSDRFLRLLREPAALYKLRRLEDEREAARNRGNVVSLSARFRTPLEADVILRAPLFKLRIGGG